MSCDAIRLELPAYVRTRLDPGTAQTVERHLRECADCQTEARAIRQLETLLETHLPTMSPSPTFASSFANRLAAEVLAEERQAVRSGFFSWRFRWLMPLGAAAVLAIVIARQAAFEPAGPAPVAQAPAQAPVVEVARSEPAAGSAAGTQEPRVASLGEAPAPPSEILDRLDLFIDYAVIEQLELIDPVGRAG